MKGKRFKKIISMGISVGVIVSCLVVFPYTVYAGNIETSKVLYDFVNESENTDAKPMVRFWFPDAGAGLTTDELTNLNDTTSGTIATNEYISLVSDMITMLYDAGFGGAEITMLADGSDYGSDFSSTVGWGSNAWVRVLNQAYETANDLGGGDGSDFKVDLTISAHWPCIVDTIDPNDDEQQQQLTSSSQIITEDEYTNDNADGKIQLGLPVQRTNDAFNTINLDDSDRSATFLFTEKLVGTTLAIQEADGSLDYKTMNSINAEKVVDESSTGSANGTGSGYAGYACGVPGTDYIAKINGIWQEADLQNGQIQKAPDGGYLLDDNGNIITDSSQTGNVVEAGAPVYVVSENNTIQYFAAKACERTNTFGITENADGTYADENGRTFMDDWQYYYAVNSIDIANAISNMRELEEGESYVLVNVYREGTGYCMSGGETQAMNNRTYEVDYYNRAGIQSLIDFWNNNMLDKEVNVYDKDGNTVTSTLRNQMQGNKGNSIFEDSLELSKTSDSFWSAHIVDTYTEEKSSENIGEEGDWERVLGYQIANYLPILAGYSVSNDQDDMSTKITSDFSDLLSNLFQSEHEDVASEWANTISDGYRFQSSTNQDEAIDVDIVEADNGTLSEDGGNDGVRSAISTVNLRGDQYLSMEALTSTTNDPDYYTSMIELNNNFSGGINRVILHGTPFLQSVNGHIDDWPGWTFANDYWGSGYGAWSSRQVFWDDIDVFTDYVTRVQGVLQEATTKVPVLFVGESAITDELLDSGYNYNTTSENVLMQDDIVSASDVVNGVLKPDGLASEVLIVNNVTSVDSTDFIQKLIDFANAGLHVVLYNSDLSMVSGVSVEENANALSDKSNVKAEQLFKELQTTSNVQIVTSDAELMTTINADTNNSISYSQSGLQATHLVDNSDHTDYYYLYNNSSEGSIAYGNVGVGLDMSNVSGNTISTEITIKKNGIPYMLNAYTGEITIINNYVDNGDGTISFPINMAAWDSEVIACSTDTDAFTSAGAKNEEVKNAIGETINLTNADWNLVLKSYGPTTDTDDTATFYDTTVTEKEIGTVKLGLWSSLNNYLDFSDYAELGITGDKLQNVRTATDPVPDNLAEYISGKGIYTTQFTLSDNATGAIFDFEHKDASKTNDAQTNQDMVTKVTITDDNGNVVFGTDHINPLVNEVDLTNLEGGKTYTLSVELSTTLRNREALEGACVSRYTLSSYGLTGASITAYTDED